MSANEPTPSSAAPVASPRAGAAGSEAKRASRPLRRRRGSVVLPAFAGAVAGALYAHFGLGMMLSPPLVMTALGGMTLVLTSLALWRVLDPLTGADTREAEEKRAPIRLRELEREKQAVLKAIKEIELDYQMRKIAENDYREMVERYRARALRVMGELQAGDDYRALIEHELRNRVTAMRAGAPAAAGTSDNRLASAGTKTEEVHAAPASAAGTCASCATRNDIDARFCKGCGKNLTSADGTAPAGSAAE